MTGSISYKQIEDAREPVPRTLMLIGESKSASWAWRVEWPCKAMRDRGFIADWVLTNEVSNALYALQAGRFNLVVAPRLHWKTRAAGEDWIKAVRSYDCGWAYEIDDNGWSPEIVDRQAQLFELEWFKGKQQLESERQERIAIINEADGVIVSTSGLAEVAREFTTRPVWVIPNLIDTDWFLGRMSDAKRIIPPLTVGWSGGVRDQEDLDVVAEAWTRVAKRYPHVKFVIHGVTPKNLATAVPGDQLVLVAWSDLPDYPRALMNVDIMCCAVADNVFNRCKSNIKWLEASLAGASSVVSDVVYGDCVEHEKTGFVCRTVDDWDEYISKLVEDEALRRDIAAQASQTVCSDYSLSQRWQLWPEALGSILLEGKSLGG